NGRFLSLGVGKSVVIDLPRDVKDVLVADPKIANAVVRSAQRAYIIGAAVGQTNIFFFDAAGQQIAAYDIAVKRDLNGVRAALRQTLASADIDIEGVGDGVMLTGTVTSPAESQQAFEAASFLAGGEFPIPKGYTCDPVTHVCQTQVDFKKFGITLNFTPVVLAEGRISLRVMTEVSDLSNDNALTLTQSVSATQTNSVTIPSIVTRRAETT